MTDENKNKPRAKTKIELMRNGKVHWETTTESHPPDVQIAATAGIADFTKFHGARASACIYCGSSIKLSTEHVLPYALGGTVTVPRGSCEACRQKTQVFEQAVLRGPMRMVRYIQGMQSRTKHADTPKTVPVLATMADGQVIDIDAPADEAPILLPFPLFKLPGYLEPGNTALKLIGTVTGSFGAEPREFGKKYGARELSLRLERNDAVAFAQMIAKIAYCCAHLHDELRLLNNSGEIVRAFLDAPDTIGRFVGTLPPPYLKYSGMSHRIFTRTHTERRLLFYEVQLFAGAGAPTYIAVIGTFRDDVVIDERGVPSLVS